MNTTHLFAAFRSREDADRAFSELEHHGFHARDLSIIAKHEEHAETHSVAGDTAAGAVSGAATGTVIGGIAGLLAGAGIIPAIAGLLIGGPVAAALGLTGIAAATVSGALTGAAAGGLVGALMGIGLSRTDAEYYERTLDEGGLVMAVPVMGSQEMEARSILEANHAEQIRTVDLTKRSQMLADHRAEPALASASRAAHRKPTAVRRSTRKATRRSK